MIKKTLGLLISCFGLINITFGYAYINEIGLMTTPNGTNLSYVDENLNLIGMLSNSETEYNFLYSVPTTLILGRKGNRLYSFNYYQTTGKQVQGYVNKIYECTYVTVQSNNKLTLNDTISHCTELGDIELLGNYIGHINYYAFGSLGMGSSKYAAVLCIIESDPTTVSSSNKRICLFPDTTDSENYNRNSKTITEINELNLFNSSPFNGSSGGGIVIGSGGIALDSTGSAINYFEKRYGRNENICYVGVDNVTDLYGTNGVSFQAGTGLSIFETFNELYGNTDLDKVYVWLNSWIINYSEWFGRDGNPLYLASYNSGTNQVDLRYDNLTFPFAGNPVAFYFMTSNFFNYIDPTGTEIVDYCNLKINNGTFEEILSYSTKNNITNYTEQSNKNNGLNPDGTVINNYINVGLYTGDAWISSGVDIAFSGNTTVKNSLKNFFDNIDSIYNDININSSVTGILPKYIVYGLLFVLLFKLLRRR